MTNTINNSNVSAFDKAADFIALSADKAASFIEAASLEAGIVTMNAVRRTERVATALVVNAPTIWTQAGTEADARIAARLARRGITMK
jgi:hypothetical protein